MDEGSNEDVWVMEPDKDGVYTMDHVERPRHQSAKSKSSPKKSKPDTPNSRSMPISTPCAASIPPSMPPNLSKPQGIAESFLSGISIGNYCVKQLIHVIERLK